MGRILFSVSLVVFSVAMVPEARAGDSDDRACFAAIVATMASGCAMGASVQGKTCRGALQSVRSACASLRECRYGCRMDKKTAKAEIKSNYKACKASCQGGPDKRQCKKACKASRKSARKAMRTSRKDCKKSCRNDYKTKECKRARTKLVAWSSAMGASMAALTKYCKP